MPVKRISRRDAGYDSPNAQQSIGEGPEYSGALGAHLLVLRIEYIPEKPASSISRSLVLTVLSTGSSHCRISASSAGTVGGPVPSRGYWGVEISTPVASYPLCGISCASNTAPEGCRGSLLP